MKKTALIVAAVLLAAGLALGFAAFASAGFNLTWFKGEPAEVKNYSVEETFDRIEIDEDTSDIRFARSDDGKARVECRETKKSAHTVTAENGVLKIQRQKITGWKNLITFSFEKTVVTVYLPETAYESLAIDTHTGDTDIPEWLRFGSVSIRTSTGDVRSRASVSGEISIESDTGDIFLDDLSADAIGCRVTTADVWMQNVACAGDVYVKVSTGRTTLNGLTAKNFTSEGSTGDLSLENVRIDGAISIDRSTGDVTFNGSDAAEIMVKTSTGDVTGTLLSEKVFKTESSTGDVRVPFCTSGGKCEITTSTGDIVIRIADGTK